jgi:hypothetical protein
VLIVRTLVDPNDPNDVNAVHALQDAIKVDQTGGPGKFEVPNWDQASQKTVREALLTRTTWTRRWTLQLGASSARTKQRTGHGDGKILRDSMLTAPPPKC